MPAIQDLPDFVERIFVHESCACITEFESHHSASSKNWRGFLLRCRGVRRVDISTMPNIRDFGDHFLHQCENLKTVNFPTTTPPTEMKIGSLFLANCPRLKAVDLAFIAHVTNIPEGFLICAESLAHVHLPFTPALTEIGNGFFSVCPALQTVTLSEELQKSPSGVTSVGEAFFAECDQLGELDLRFLSCVVAIGPFFLNNCRSLSAVDLSGMTELNKLGRRFMCGCTGLQQVLLPLSPNLVDTPSEMLCNAGLETIDLSPLAHVITIGDGFLCKSRCLKTIHLPFTRVTSIATAFLAECVSLESVTIASEFEKAQTLNTVNDFFFTDCSALKSLDLKFLANVTHIGDSFLNRCKSLRGVDTTPLTKVVDIGLFFLASTAIEEVDLGIFHNMSTIAQAALYNCTALRTIHNAEKGLANVTAVGDNFMSHCDVLEDADLNVALSQIQRVGAGFMMACSLSSFDMSSWINLKVVGSRFLQENEHLTTVSLPRVALRNALIGEEFLGATALTSVDLRCFANCQFEGPILTRENGTLRVIIAPSPPAKRNSRGFGKTAKSVLDVIPSKLKNIIDSSEDTECETTGETTQEVDKKQPVESTFKFQKSGGFSFKKH